MRRLALKTRATKVETEHFGYISLVGTNAKPDKTLNDDKSFYLRSCIKAMQAKVCKDILQDELRDDFLALALASHRCQDQQLTLLKEMLQTFSITEDSLYCGVNSETKNARFKSRLHHYCAGKHIALIAASKKLQLDTNYQDLKHPLQQKVLNELQRLSGKTQIDTALDGCGLPTFYMSITDLAKSFTQASKESTYQEIFKVANNYSQLISDQGRLDQELMQQFQGKFFAKSGAEGMIIVTKLDSHETLVIKILDGSTRVKDFVAKKIMEELNWLKVDELKIDPLIYTSQNQVAGEIIGLEVLR